MRQFRILLFLMIAMTIACNKDDDPIPTPEIPDVEKVPVQVEFSIEAKVLKTRAIDEDAISSINIYFFSLENKDNYHFYRPNFESSFTFEMLPGKYMLFVITNVHGDLGEMNMLELARHRYMLENMTDDIPMTGSMSITVNGDTTLPTLSVTRAAAKITYSITVDAAVAANIKLRSVQFCNVPKSITLFNFNSSSTDIKYYINDEVIQTNNAKSYSGVYYMLENRQGNVSSITDQRDKSPANAPACATYMRILADGTEKVLEYIVYLGENSTSNFDVIRNTKHDMNLYIKGENEIDNRVTVYDGLYFGKANCHICSGNVISFDVTPYRTQLSNNFIYTNEYAGKEYEATSAKLIWQGTQNLITSSTIKNNILTVKTSGAKGNAVVAICDAAGTVRWSFHIWCTGGELPRSQLCENYAKARLYVMDRNLGALSISPAHYKDAGGLLYQWGRKDPFPNANEDNIYTPTKSGTFLTIFPAIDKSKIATFEDLLLHFASNPASFIQDAEGYDDPRCLGLWGDPDGNNPKYNSNIYAWSSKKTIYDPCPEGYRVANKYTWTGISPTGLNKEGDSSSLNEIPSANINVVGPWNYGWTFTGVSEGVYYPTSPNRNSDGKLNTNAYDYNLSSTWLWSSTIVTSSYNNPLAGVMGHGRNCIYLYNNSWGYGPEFGFNVRCVQE